MTSSRRSSPSDLPRVGRLERARREAQGRQSLVVQDQDEAERLRAQHLEALVIVTGVSRSSAAPSTRQKSER
jgi:hypothetical protein